MCEALGNPPCGRNPPPIWLPKWEEGVKATVVAVVREQVKRLPRVEQRTPWRHAHPASCSVDGGAFATRQWTTSASAADASVSRKAPIRGGVKGQGGNVTRRSTGR